MLFPSSELGSRLRFPPPRVASVPAFSRTLGSEIIDLMQAVGRPLDPWQQFVLLNGLGQNPNPLGGWDWAAGQCGCWVPRQNGKGDVIMALELAWLFLFSVPLAVHSAHEYKTAQEGFLRIKGIIEEHDDIFGKYIKRMWQAAGEQGVELKPNVGKGNGARLRFMARTGKAGRGFSAPNLVLDEGQELTETQMAAILFVLSAQQNPQVWFFGTPPDVDNAWIYNIKNAGEANAPGLLWMDWGIETADLNDRDTIAMLKDPQTWHDTNPSMGIVRPNGTGLRPQAAANELLTMKPGLKFAMERCGMWLPEAVTEADASIDPEVWASRACVDPVKISELGDIAVSFHVNARRSHTTIGFAGKREGRWHVGIFSHKKGTADLLDDLLKIKLAYRPIAFTVDARSETTIDELKTIKIKLPEDEKQPKRGDLILPTAPDIATAFGMLVDGANNGGLEHRDQPPVNGAVVVPSRPVAGGSTFDHRRKVEVGPAIAPMLAMWSFMERIEAIKDDYDPVGNIG